MHAPYPARPAEPPGPAGSGPDRVKSGHALDSPRSSFSPIPSANPIPRAPCLPTIAQDPEIYQGAAADKLRLRILETNVVNHRARIQVQARMGRPRLNLRLSFKRSAPASPFIFSPSVKVAARESSQRKMLTSTTCRWPFRTAVPVHATTDIVEATQVQGHRTWFPAH